MAKIQFYPPDANDLKNVLPCDANTTRYLYPSGCKKRGVFLHHGSRSQHRAVPLIMVRPYLQDERGFIYMKTKPDTGFLKFPEYHPICHVGQDLELFKVFDKKLFTMMCDEIDLDVIEVKQDTKNT